MPRCSADPTRTGSCAGFTATGRHSYRVSFWPGRRLLSESIQLGVVEWQRGGVLDGLEREAGTDVLEFHRSYEALVDNVVGIDVRHDYAHQVIHIATHAVDLGHLGNI